MGLTKAQRTNRARYKDMIEKEQREKKMTLEQLKENIASKTSKQTLELLVEHLTEKNWEQLLADGGLEIATKQHDISNDYDYEIEIVIDGYICDDEFEFDEFYIGKKVINNFIGDWEEEGI